jgi:4-alpha-glucanotransferase
MKIPCFHALTLNLHQPHGNLEDLLTKQEWEAQQILWAMDRIPRSLWGYEDLARVHLSLSGSLLELLSNPRFQERVYGIVKCGDLLWHLQNTKLFEILGTAYYHPVLPLIPSADWGEQLQRWLGIGRHVFWRANFPGFWPPEMGFCMELIPSLKKMGYRYVMVDSHFVEPIDSMRWEEVRYRPHVASYAGHEIVIIVRDRELSNAQESGMEVDWFLNEVSQRVKHCNFPALICTATDGENGGWFRNPDQASNFWNSFYCPLLERLRQPGATLKPTFIDEYLDKYGAGGRVRVGAGAWNTGWHSGEQFTQWTGSQKQKEALTRIKELSRRLQDLSAECAHRRVIDSAKSYALEQAHWHLLRAETSCNIFWGEAWLDRLHQDLDESQRWLERIQ